MLTGLYLIFLLGGVLWAFLMFISGSLGLGDGDGDGGGDLGPDTGGAGGDLGHDFSGDHDISGAHGADAVHGAAAGLGPSFHFSPLSPVNIATFITGFGGMGLITLRGFHLTEALSVGLSLVTGAAFSFLIYFLMYEIFIKSESTSEAEVQRLAGTEAEVLTAIPAGGIGEIAYVTRGSRYTGMAKSLSGEPIARGAGVVIRRVIGNTFIVEKES